ncbi:TspO/MBR family protein [Bacillus salinus]|uniref:TspO/MBR family protein n=1 Tax=Bacillus sp. HMF5848 TaxID=2495421 RepID=UPI0026842FC5|nr:TspO/MBR family protein [Bacillus sp. HMF5848]
MQLFLTIIAYILVITINALANILPLNGQTTGEIANRLDVMFTPANYVFSIWGLIYLLLGIWVIAQFFKKRWKKPLYENTYSYFVISCSFNAMWIIFWHYEYFLLSVIMMTLLLLTLIALYRTAKHYNATFLELVPFSIYLGWISVATIANISYYLVYIEWSGWGLSDVTWTFVMLIVAGILAILFTTTQRDFLFPGVFIWAFIGIGLKQADVTLISNTAYTISIIIAISMLILFMIFRKPKATAE